MTVNAHFASTLAANFVAGVLAGLLVAYLADRYIFDGKGYQDGNG